MKHLVLLLSVLLLMSGCKRGDAINKKNTVLLLKVDYVTQRFEGGIEQNLTSPLPAGDTIPLSIDYKPAGDFGSIALYYKQRQQLLFKGTIIWNGTGGIVYPLVFNAAGTFAVNSAALAYPGFEILTPYAANEDSIRPPYEDVWAAVAKLRIVADYRKAGKKIGLMLYTPSVGIGNPADWDWIVVMVK